MDRIARLPIMLALVAFCCACASNGEVDLPNDTMADDTRLASGSDSSVCGTADYPCRWADVDPAVHEREGELAAGLSEILEEGDLKQAYDWVRNQDDVVEAHLEETMVVFRIAGGMPHVTVEPLIGEAVSPTAVNAQLISHVIETPPLDVVGVGTDREHPQNHKRALFLQPYQWQGLTMDHFAGEESVAMLKSIPDYAHGPDAVKVVYDDDVTPFSFQNWDSFDVIFVESHGGTWGGGTWIATGVKVEESSYWEQCRELMEPYSDMTGVKCGLLKDKPTDTMYVNLGVTIRFWEEEYGARGGLDKTVIYMGGCLTLVREEVSEGRPDLPKLLAGNSSAYLGWTGTVYFHKEGNVASALLYLLAGPDQSRTVKAALDTLCRNDLCGGEGFSPSGNTQLGIYQNGADPGSLRVYDIATFVDPEVPTNLLENGAELQFEGTAGDGEHDKLEITIDLIGIIDPDDTSGELTNVVDEGSPADLYNLRFFIGHEERDIGADNLGRAVNPTASVVDLGDNKYRYSFTADLGFDVDPDDNETTLKVVVDWRGGGISDYEIDVVLVETSAGATITIDGQTWDFVWAEGFADCGVSGGNPGFGVDDGEPPFGGIGVTGSVDGDLSSGVTFHGELRPDGGMLNVIDRDSRKSWLAAADRQHTFVLHLVPEGHSQIDQITFDGNRIYGTATFIEGNAYQDAWRTNGPYPLPVTGSFEIRCQSDISDVTGNVGGDALH